MILSQKRHDVYLTANLNKNYMIIEKIADFCQFPTTFS